MEVEEGKEEGEEGGRRRRRGRKGRSEVQKEHPLSTLRNTLYRTMTAFFFRYGFTDEVCHNGRRVDKEQER